MRRSGLWERAGIIGAALTLFAATFFNCASNAKTSSAPQSGASAGTKIKYVAVVETEVDAQSGASAELNPAEVRQITAALRREAVENLPRGTYNIMTTETVQAQGGAVLEECADENCVITLGSKIGADYIVRGIISKYGVEFTMSVEMYETDNGTLVASSEYIRSENTRELLDKVMAACANMYRKFVNPQGFVPKREQQPVAYTAPAAPQPAVAVQQPIYHVSTPITSMLQPATAQQPTYQASTPVTPMPQSATAQQPTYQASTPVTPMLQPATAQHPTYQASTPTYQRSNTTYRNDDDDETDTYGYTTNKSSYRTGTRRGAIIPQSLSSGANTDTRRSAIAPPPPPPPSGANTDTRRSVIAPPPPPPPSGANAGARRSAIAPQPPLYSASAGTTRSGDAIAGYVPGDDKDANELGEAVVNKLVNSRKYSTSRHSSRTFYSEVKKLEQNSERRGELLNEWDICRIGDNFGVNYMCFIKVEKTGRSGANINAHIIDLSNCKKIASASKNSALLRSTEEILNVADELSRALLR